MNSRCYRARVVFELDGAIQQHSQRALSAAAGSPDAKARGGPSIRKWVGPEVKEAEVLDVFLSASHLLAVACAPRWKTRAPPLPPGDNVSGGASPAFNRGSADWR